VGKIVLSGGEVCPDSRHAVFGWWGGRSLKD
jgi:hypothetical protein